MLTIRKFHESDLKALQLITLSSFCLGSLAVDPNLPSQIQGQYFYNTICKNSFYPNSTNCLIASLTSNPIGYIIYGINKKINEIIKLETGSIILFAIDKTQQNKGIGTKLLTATLSFFQQKNIKLVTVGTDANNISALHLYHKFNFKKISDWETFRLHQDKSKTRQENSKIKIEPFGDEKGCLQILINSEQENSLLHEDNILYQSKVKLQAKIASKTIAQIKSNSSYSLVAKNKADKIIGIVVYNRDKAIEGIIDNSPKHKVLQIKAIAAISNDNSTQIFKELLTHLAMNRDGVNYIEAFCGFEKNQYRKALEECDFKNIHTTTTLHLNL